MKTKFLIAVVMLLAAGTMLYMLVFKPDRYTVQTLRTREGTNYWQLPTGSRIAYTLLEGQGIRKPVPLIYLHGGPGAGITDREIAVYRRIAAQGYDIYLYDQIGCGRSGRLENIGNYTAERHLRDLEHIVKITGAPKVVLIGQSWGSILSTMFLAKNPAAVHKLVITAPAPIQPSRKELAAIPPPDSLELRAPSYPSVTISDERLSTRSKMMYYLARKFEWKLVPDSEADQLATHLTNDINKAMVCDTQQAVTAEGTEGLYVQYMTSKSLGKVHNPRPALKKLNTPVLVMKAQCDNQPWGYTAEYLDIFQNHTFRPVRDAGHNIFLEQPDAYVRIITAFLE